MNLLIRRHSFTRPTTTHKGTLSFEAKGMKSSMSAMRTVARDWTRLRQRSQMPARSACNRVTRSDHSDFTRPIQGW